MASPQFVMTTAGLAAATAATPSGPYVHIVEFRLGSGVGYTPIQADSGLRGTLLYSGVPRSYTMVAGDTGNFICEVPSTAGPFMYGEIGLYLPGGVLFALASFPQLQQKFNLAADGFPHVLRFNCLIKLAQGVGVFQATTSNQVDILEVPDTGYISAPDTMAQQPNIVIVHENAGLAGHFMLFKESSNKWTPLQFSYTQSASIAGLQTVSEVTSSSFGSLDGTTANRYAIQTPDGQFRIIASITGNTATLTKTLAAPLNVGTDYVWVYEADTYYSAAVVPNTEFNELRNLLNPIIGSPTGSTAATAKGWNQQTISAPAGSVPTTQEWGAFAQRTKNAAQLLNLPTNTDFLGFSSFWNTGVFTRRMRQFAALNDLIVRISQYGARVPWHTLDVFNSVNRTLNNYWTQLHHDIDVNFSTVTDAQMFFNSGGYIGFALKSTAKNYTQSIQRFLFSQLGVIRFTGFQSDSIGPLSITYRDGDGVNTDFGNCGFYGLSGSRRRVFHHRAALGTPTHKQPDSESIMIEMYATSLSATHFKLEMWITDSSGTPYFDFPLSDPAYGSYGSGSLLAGTTAISQVVYGKAPTSLLTNGIPTPSIATSPSTQW